VHINALVFYDCATLSLALGAVVLKLYQCQISIRRICSKPVAMYIVSVLSCSVRFTRYMKYVACFINRKHRKHVVVNTQRSKHPLKLTLKCQKNTSQHSIIHAEYPHGFENFRGNRPQINAKYCLAMRQPIRAVAYPRVLNQPGGAVPLTNAGSGEGKNTHKVITRKD
jgi:hypothetical protein